MNHKLVDASFQLSVAVHVGWARLSLFIEELPRDVFPVILAINKLSALHYLVGSGVRPDEMSLEMALRKLRITTLDALLHEVDGITVTILRMNIGHIIGEVLITFLEAIANLIAYTDNEPRFVLARLESALLEKTKQYRETSSQQFTPDICPTTCSEYQPPVQNTVSHVIANESWV
jgi:hypothetical protein